MMQPPKIEVTAHSNGLTAGWRDAERRYHIWIDGAGNPRDDVIHSNLIVKSDPRMDGHRALKQSAKKWAPLVAAIVDKIKRDDLFIKARERAAAERRAAEEDRLRKVHETDLARLERAIKRLPTSAGDMLRALPEATRLAFVSAIDH